MFVSELALESFRNFSDLEVSFSEHANVFYGDNGSGKTNLLEAVFVSCLARSHRGAADNVMLQQGKQLYRVESETVDGGRQYRLAVAYQRGERKQVAIDMVPVRLAELFERFAVVSAGPEDTDILSGAPAVRRRFMDIYISQLSKSYIFHLSRYTRGLAQKNAALRAEGDFSAFNRLLVQHGSEVMLARRSFLEGIGASAQEYYQNISGGSQLSIRYQPSVKTKDDSAGLTEVQSAFEAALSEASERECVMKMALVGPHRDDIDLGIGDYTARAHASQGEMRTAALALKLGVYRLLSQLRSTQPILLLDEVFAELDAGRVRGVVAAFADVGQVFLTTAVEPPSILNLDSRRFRISEGNVIKVD